MRSEMHRQIEQQRKASDMTTDEIIMATRTGTRVWCWHRSSIHNGMTRSSVKIMRTRSDGWVLVRFDDDQQVWCRESELEQMAGA